MKRTGGLARPTATPPASCSPQQPPPPPRSSPSIGVNGGSTSAHPASVHAMLTSLAPQHKLRVGLARPRGKTAASVALPLPMSPHTPSPPAKPTTKPTAGVKREDTKHCNKENRSPLAHGGQLLPRTQSSPFKQLGPKIGWRSSAPTTALAAAAAPLPPPARPSPPPAVATRIVPLVAPTVALAPGVADLPIPAATPCTPVRLASSAPVPVASAAGSSSALPLPSTPSSQDVVILGTPSPPPSQPQPPQHTEDQQLTPLPMALLQTPIKREQHVEIPATPSPIKSELQPPRPPPAIALLPSSAALGLNSASTAATPSPSLPLPPPAPVVATIPSGSSSIVPIPAFRPRPTRSHRSVALPMPDLEPPDFPFSPFSPSPTPSAKREKKEEAKATGSFSQAERTSTPVVVASVAATSPPPLLPAPAPVPPPAPFEPPQKHSASQLPEVFVVPSGTGSLHLAPTMSQARREEEYHRDGHHSEELFASAKDEPLSAHLLAGDQASQERRQVDAPHSLTPFPSAHDPSQPPHGAPPLSGSIPPAGVAGPLPSPSLLPSPPPAPPAMHDDSYMDDLPASQTSCAGFIPPSMEVAMAYVTGGRGLKTPPRLTGEARRAAVAAAVAAFPTTPSSTATPHSSSSPRTPICASFQPTKPTPEGAAATTAVLSPSPRIYPAPPLSLQRTVLTTWRASFGQDMLGCFVGDMLEWYLRSSAREGQLEYEAYTAYLIQVLRAKPFLVEKMKNRAMSACDVVQDYPPTEMPTDPRPSWKDILGATDQPTGGVVSAAAPAIGVATPVMANVVHAVTPASGLAASKKKTPRGGLASVASNRSILSFTTSSGLTVAEKLAADVTRAAAAVAEQTKTPRRLSVGEAYALHQAQLQQGKSGGTSTATATPHSAHRTPSASAHAASAASVSAHHTPALAQPHHAPTPTSWHPRRFPPAGPTAVAARPIPLQPQTPTRRLYDELSAVSEEQEAAGEEGLDFPPLPIPTAGRPLPALSEPPELERPPPWNLFSERQATSPVTMRQLQAEHEHHHPLQQQQQPQPHHLESVDVPMEMDQAEDRSELAISPVKLEACSSAPGVARSVASFLSPPRPAPAAPNADTLRTPFALPATPIVTISPLTTPSSNSPSTGPPGGADKQPSSSSSSGEKFGTPSLAQRTVKKAEQRQEEEDGDVRMEDADAMTASRGEKRRTTASAPHQKASNSKKAKRTGDTADISEDEDEVMKDALAAAAPTTARPGGASYHHLKQALARRSKPTRQMASGWRTTADGDREFVTRAGVVVTGQDAHVAQQEEEDAQLRRLALHKRQAEVDLTTMSQESATDTAAAANHTAVAEPDPLPSPRHSLAYWNIPPAIVAAYRQAGVRCLYDWQVDCLAQPGVMAGRSNLVYSAATSAGKTLVAEVLMLNRMLSPLVADARSDDSDGPPPSYNRKVLFVLPYVSIVDEKTRDLSEKLTRLGFCVKGFHGQQSGRTDEHGGASVHQLNPDLLTPEIDIALTVIEKAGMLWDQLRAENRLGEICAVVVDELHMVSGNINSNGLEGSQSNPIGTGGQTSASGFSNRGYLLELLLTKVATWNVDRLASAHTGLDPSHAHPPLLPIQIIGLSATLPNMSLFQQWLRPCAVFETKFRPTPLKEYLVWGKEVWRKVDNTDHGHHAQQTALTDSLALAAPVDAGAAAAVPLGASGLIPAPRFRFEKVRDLKPSPISEQVRLRSKELALMSQAIVSDSHDRRRHDISLLLDLCEESGVGVLVFCPKKAEVEAWAKWLAKGVKRRTQVRQSGVLVSASTAGASARPASASKQKTIVGMFKQAAAAAAAATTDGPADATSSTSGASAAHAHERLLLLHRLAALNEGVDPILQRTVPHGVAFHHAGLTGDERLLVETAFRTGVLSILCCTSTLAAGVNLPARRVIFNGPRIGIRQLNITEYQQMAGRAGRTGQMGDTPKGGAAAAEGSSFLIVHSKEEFENMQKVLNHELPRLTSALDMHCGVQLLPAAEPTNNQSASSSSAGLPPANLYLSHGILDSLCSLQAAGATGSASAFASSVRATVEDVYGWMAHTLLGVQKKEEEERSREGRQPATGAAATIATSQARMPRELQQKIAASLHYLCSHRLLDARTLCATSLGSAICSAGLNPHEGLRLFQELKHTRAHGLSLESQLHLCWLLTPVPVEPSYVHPAGECARWERMCHRWVRMTDADRSVCRLLPFPPSTELLHKDTTPDTLQYLEHMVCLHQRHAQQHRWKAAWSPRHAAYIRLFEAMTLQDLLNDAVPMRQVQQATGRSAGELHVSLRSACMVCSQLVVLCESLHWRDLSLVLAAYRDRFAYNGAPQELLQLLRIPELKMRRARDLHAGGYTTIESIAVRASPQQLYELFDQRQPYRPTARTAPRTVGATTSASQTTSITREQQAHTRVPMEQATSIYEGARGLFQQDQKRKASVFASID